MRIAILFAGALAALLSLAVPAQAAAIDCATAKGRFETAICTDPALHQLDQDLSAAYDKLASTLSETAQAQVHRDEHDRRAFIGELCDPGDGACLGAAYRQGVGSVAKFADQPAGGALVPVERFRLTPADPKAPAQKTSIQLAFPRLDRPTVPWTDRFAQAARQKAEGLLPDDDGTDAVVDYRPTYLAPDVAAVALAVWSYPHGAAHGIGRQVSLAYLPAKQRGLLPGDLFQSGTTWSGFLAERALEDLQEQAKAGGWTLSVSGPGELETQVADPANWLIRPAGLGLYFAPASVGPYVAGDREVLVPWADLKPYLSPTPALGIPDELSK
jgi:uncharacterized protein